MWTDECYDEIRKGDRVWYKTPQDQTHSGRAIMYGPAGWVINTSNGVTRVVQDGHNYLGHKPGKGFREDDHFGRFLSESGIRG